VKMRWSDAACRYDLGDMTLTRPKVVALMSGGLDSSLAAALTQRLGFSVIGLYVGTGFSAGEDRRDTVLAACRRLGIPVRLRQAGESYLDLIRYPKHGYGSAANPCLDCRIFLLRMARELMDEEGAEFVITGEVLGQRPMSQHYRALRTVAEESGLGNRLVRPLSGRLLPATYPEEQGWVRRDQWLDIEGRSRRRQLALAAEWGIEEFGQPSGGCCILLAKSYARKLRDVFEHRGRDAVAREDFDLLRYGRHFRLSPRVKIIVGRNEEENAVLEGFANKRWILSFPDVPGPVALVEGEPSTSDLEFAARLSARYADAPQDQAVRVFARHDGEFKDLRVVPLSPDDPAIERMRFDE